MKSVLYGGSFDPLTQAHMDIIGILSEKFDFVYVVPTNVEGYKANCKMFSFGERCKKIQDAVKDFKNVIVSYVEEHVPADYQFVSTIKYYAREFAGDDNELYFALGSDSFATLKEWKDWEIIVKLSKIVVINRDGDYIFPEDIPYEFIDYHNSSSSTKIRAIIEAEMKNYVKYEDPLTSILRIEEFTKYCERQGVANTIENYVRYMNQNNYSLNLKELLSSYTI